MIVDHRSSATTKLLYLISLLSLVSATNTVVEVAVERDILVALYQYTAGEFWTKHNDWNSPVIHHCDWEGISCISPGSTSRQLADVVVDERSVEQIDLSENNLEGSVPLSLLLLLPNLRLLRLNGNNVDYRKTAQQEKETLGVVLDVTNVTVTSNVQHLDLSRTSVEDLNRVFTAGNGGTVIHTPYLTDFYASEAKILGSVPEFLMKMSSLERLELEHNSLTGTLPWTLGQLQSLKYLNIADNSLEGTLPSSFNLLVRLRYLLAEKNRFTGTIPRGLTSGEYTPLLEQIDLSDQRSESTSPGNTIGLSGQVPAFDSQKRLRRIDLGVNSFSGTVPPTLLIATAFADFDFIILSSNLITGNIPDQIMQRIPIDGLFLDNNKVTGVSSCPSSEFGCSAVLCPPLTYEPRAGRQEESHRPCLDCPLNTKYWGQIKCRLEANTPTASPIPVSPKPTGAPAIGPTSPPPTLVPMPTQTPTQMPSEAPDLISVDERAILVELYLSSGGEQWTNSIGWSTPNKSDTFCSWFGVVCVSEVDRSVKDLHLDSNNLIGLMPTSIYTLSNLTYIDLSHNNGLSVSFQGIGNARSLEALDLSSTIISSIEGITDAASRLKELHISDIGGFDGKPFPVDIYKLTNLRQLTMDYNNAAGTLPEDLGQLSNLEVLSLANNELSGSLPINLSKLTDISSLRLSTNHFTGSLPSGFETLTSLSVLDLSNQWSNGQDDDFDSSGRSGFSGPLPSLSRFSQLRRVDLGVNSFSGTIPQNFLAGVNSDSDGGLFEFADIGENSLTGTVPASLGRLHNVYLHDNKLSGIDQLVCDSLPATLLQFGCDAVLCSPGSFTLLGRQVSAEKPCSPCNLVGGAPYFGSTECGGSFSAANNSSEQSALELIYDSCGGPDWSLENNWKQYNLSTCLWDGIKCSAKSEIVSISLRAANLVGTFPTDAVLRGIPSLRSLILDGNSVIFPFYGMEEANSLETLDLTNTELDSVYGIDAAPSLKSVYLASNILQGEFPTSLLKLTNLERIDLSFNALSKSIPGEINVLTHLEFLSLHDNELTGTIPTTLGQMSKLLSLSLQANSLTGSIPTQMNMLTKISFIDLSSQNGNGGEGLTGKVPNFAAFSELHRMNLSGNKLTGSLPDNFLNTTTSGSFEQLDLSRNKLTGTVPSCLAKFPAEQYDVTDNQFSAIAPALCDASLGGVVEAFGCDAVLCSSKTYNSMGRQILDADICESCPNNQFFGMTTCGGSGSDPTNSPVVQSKLSSYEVLSKFYDATSGGSWRRNSYWKQDGVSVCQWYGITCSEEGQVEEIVLSANNLVGTVPHEIFQLPYLKTLVLDSNFIEMQDLYQIEDATQLQTLDLSNTAIKDVVGIGKARSLQELHIKSNNLNGTFPEEIFSVVTLEQLDFDFCHFSGILGSGIGKLSSLKLLAGDNNNLCGALPSEIANLNNLITMRLGRNSFSGSIPSSLNALSSIALLDLSDQTEHGGPGLSGRLPVFGGLSSLTQLILKSNAISGTVPANFLRGINPVLFEFADLSSNAIKGSLPSSLAHLSHIHLYDNLITGVASEMCSASRGVIYEKYSCDAVLCPPKTYNPHGRQESATNNCKTCEEANFWGTTDCPPKYNTPLPSVIERDVLTKFYTECGGEFWNDNQNWMSPASICTWTGIQCALGFNDSRIEVIELGANNIVGTPPTELFALPALSLLSLYSNPLENVDFTGIENARNLKELILDETGVSSLAGIEKAQDLEILNLRFNQLKNGFPSEIASLTSLHMLTMAFNDMTGPLPLFLEGLTLMKSLLLSANSLTGNLHGVNFPGSLRRLDLSDNLFTGSIPGSFLALVNFQADLEIDLARNDLTGSLPTVLSRFNSLSLYVADNRISTIDSQLCSMKNWNGGDVGKYGCDAILCPPGYSAPKGRCSSSGECSKCLVNGSKFFGSSACGTESSAHVFSTHFAIGTSFIVGCILQLVHQAWIV